MNWEYWTMNFFDTGEPGLLTGRLDECGKHRWELVSCTKRSDKKMFLMIFKRPLESKEPTT
jgi:hypothetical protein